MANEHDLSGMSTAMHGSARRAWLLEMGFACPRDGAVAGELMAAVLEEIGTLGWSEQQDRRSGKTILRAYMPADAERDLAVDRIRRAAARLCAEGLLASQPTLTAKAVEDHDWVAECRRHFRPFRIAPGLRLVPPWQSKRREAGSRSSREVEIVIEPGAAFGTGRHETTRICLRALVRHVKGGERVADIGAGSGILAIASVLLGARSATAIEIDPQAIENLHRNIRLNGLARRVRVFTGDLADLARRCKASRRGYDLILCNMLAEQMRPLLSHFGALAPARRTATVIVSGHLWKERSSVERRLGEAGIVARAHRKLGEWGAIVGEIGR